MYVLNMYNAMVAYRNQSGHLMQTAKQEERQMSCKREMDQLIAAAFSSAAAEEANTRSTSTSTKKGETLILTTYGPIWIVMHPDLSQRLVNYIHWLIDNGVCSRCILYSAKNYPELISICNGGANPPTTHRSYLVASPKSTPGSFPLSQHPR
jgi:hypothetical protein